MRKVLEFASRHALPHAGGVDPTSEIARQLGPIQVLPTHVVIDRQGMIVQRLEGDVPTARLELDLEDVAMVAEPWTVATLAKRVRMSRSGFAARFTELVGESPVQYLARWRVTRAAELLRDGDDGIEAIANLVGYESLPAFSRAFKRWQGASPATFRRALEQQGLRRK